LVIFDPEEAKFASDFQFSVFRQQNLEVFSYSQNCELTQNFVAGFSPDSYNHFHIYRYLESSVFEANSTMSELWV
jgi:hypothetical protein